VRDARSEAFDFLGYTFAPMHSPKNGHCYLGATPSKKAVSRFRESVRKRLRPGNQVPWLKMKAALNRVLRGWAGYFNYGTLTKVRRSLDWYVCERVRDFLRRRHKVQGLGSGQFPVQRVHGELGVLTLESLPRASFAKASA
jgi:RNA-directed DNA polymerase